MNIFITGASGFVGGAIVRALKDRHTFWAMSRSPHSDKVIEALGARPVRAELGQVQPEHLTHIDTVIHCAAYVEDWGPEHLYWQINVEGTSQLLDQARAAGVRRLIHMGTEAACFDGRPLVQIDEAAPYALNSPFLYSRTKAEAERRVLAAHQPERFLTLSLRPRLIWGPGDQTILPRILNMVKNKQFVWLDHGSALTSTTHIANLVRAVELSLQAGQGGQAYFVGDPQIVTYREFFTRLLATQGVTAPETSVPGWLARGLAAGLESVWKLTRQASAPPLTAFAAAMLSREVTLRLDKAHTELGYAPVLNLEQGLQTLTQLDS